MYEDGWEAPLDALAMQCLRSVCVDWPGWIEERGCEVQSLWERKDERQSGSEGLEVVLTCGMHEWRVVDHGGADNYKN